MMAKNSTDSGHEILYVCYHVADAIFWELFSLVSGRGHHFCVNDVLYFLELSFCVVLEWNVDFYHFYSFKLMPFIGKIISKDSRAYEYLPESIQAFPSGNDFLVMMMKCNFVECKQIPLSFKIATIYIGHKK